MKKKISISSSFCVVDLLELADNVLSSGVFQCTRVRARAHVCYNKSNTYHLLPTLTAAGDYFNYHDWQFTS